MKKQYLIKGLKSFYSAETKPQNPDGYNIEITGNRISRIGANIQNPSAQVIDAENCVAIPGLANTHHHFYQVLTRVIPKMLDMPLFPWLVNHYNVFCYGHGFLAGNEFGVVILERSYARRLKAHDRHAA